MKKLIKFGSIEQFRNIVKQIKYNLQYIGDDANGELMYDTSIKLPIISAYGTEKIHGTFAGVAIDNNEMWVQSKNVIITVGEDHAGFAKFVNERKDAFHNILTKLASEYNIDLTKNKILLCGEFAGQGIQKNTALSGHEKCYHIFNYFKVKSNDESVDFKWYSTNAIEDSANDIYNVMNSETWNVTIDFNDVETAKQTMYQIIEENEKHSPLGKKFGFLDNIMEGVVFSFFYNDELYQWKVKGEKHNTRTVKPVKPVNIERQNKIIEFVNNHACTLSRLEQAYNEVFDIINGGEPDIKQTGSFIKWVHKDVLKEESDLIDEIDIPWNDINPVVTKQARIWLIEQLR